MFHPLPPSGYRQDLPQGQVIAQAGKNKTIRDPEGFFWDCYYVDNPKWFCAPRPALSKAPPWPLDQDF